jgi:uncharacterized protein YndB with AHSA1/START domain
MNESILEIKAALQIAKKPEEVFDAIVDPAKMSNYFISQSTGKMETGKQLVWRFPEFDMNVPVRVGEIVKPSYISYYWGSPADTQQELLVEMNLAPFGEGHTVVTITEKSMDNNEAGINWLKGNTEGWANFLACLKAWLEYGVHLRKDAFVFRAKEHQP